MGWSTSELNERRHRHPMAKEGQMVKGRPMAKLPHSLCPNSSGV